MMKREAGNVTYLALQRLIERAWDEGDRQRLHMLSHTMDEACVQQMEGEESGCMAG